MPSALQEFLQPAELDSPDAAHLGTVAIPPDAAIPQEWPEIAAATPSAGGDAAAAESSFQRGLTLRMQGQHDVEVWAKCMCFCCLPTLW
jgi:hypothetical protein